MRGDVGISPYEENCMQNAKLQFAPSFSLTSSANTIKMNEEILNYEVTHYGFQAPH